MQKNQKADKIVISNKQEPFEEHSGMQLVLLHPPQGTLVELHQQFEWTV